MIVLHRKPTFRRTAESFGESQRHLGAYAAFTNQDAMQRDRKSTRLNSSHGYISYAVFCLKKKNKLHSIDVLPIPVCNLATIKDPHECTSIRTTTNVSMLLHATIKMAMCLRHSCVQCKCTQ